jgi:murein DD-endopeptidase MepM/ murein hydrolase activator NlpD
MKKSLNVLIYAAVCLSSVAGAALPLTDTVPGGIAVLPVAPADEPEPRVTFNGYRILTLRDNNEWKAVIGLPLSLKAGEHQVSVTQGRATKMLAFKVDPKEYETQYLTISNKKMVDPAEEDMPRIRREQERMNKANATWTPVLKDELVFDAPSQGPFSARFGLRRFYNKQPRASHTGLDIAVPEGTPILAPAAGTVIETGNFYFTGNVVFLDHGQGLVTMYIHMSRIDVVKGQTVKRGERLGAVGKTGRVTGPHLHWAVSLNNTRVDPMLFLTPAARAAGEKPATANGNSKKP